MKVRPSILLFIAVIAVLIIAVLALKRKKTEELALVASTETTAALPTSNTSVANASIYTNTQTISGTMAAPNPPPASKEQQMAEILSEANDVPILFYGKLEDQFDNPIVGAEIQGTTTIINGTTNGASRISTFSDSNGFFQLNGGNGQSLGLMLKKTGYVLATTSTLFRYSHLEDHPYIPDANNPTIIKMWKLQGAEPLFNINQRYKFHYTDAPINFDLITGEIVPTGGDIKITANRSPGVVSGRTRQDWSIQVESVDGGLIESSGDEIIYQAPADGYQKSDNFIMSTNAPHKWLGGFDQTFFLQSRNGQVYSKVNFGISINQHPDDYIWVEFHGVANTNGSRNWEATAPNEN
jgi:hypothetical protein